MLREVWGGMRMALRRWLTMLSLGGIVAIAWVILAFLLADVITQFTALRGGQEMRDRGAVVFTPYYDGAGVTEVPDPAVADLTGQIRDARTYTAVIQNVRVDDPGFAGGTPTVVLVGEAVDKTVPGLDLCAPAPCAMRGSDVAGEGVEQVEFAGHTLSPADRLPRAATYFDPSLGAVSLDDRLVLRLPAQSLPRFNGIEQEEAVSRAVMVDVPPAEVDGYVAANADQGLYLVPHDIAVDQPQRLSEIMVMSAMYVGGLMAFLSLALLAFASVTEQMLRQEQAVFAIRRRHGAGRGHTAARLAGFIGLVTLALPLPLLVMLRLLGDPVASAATWVIGAVVAVFLALWAWTIKRQTGHELKGQ